MRFEHALMRVLIESLNPNTIRSNESHIYLCCCLMPHLTCKYHPILSSILDCLRRESQLFTVRIDICLHLP